MKLIEKKFFFYKNYYQKLLFYTFFDLTFLVFLIKQIYYITIIFILVTFQYSIIFIFDYLLHSHYFHFSNLPVFDLFHIGTQDTPLTAAIKSEESTGLLTQKYKAIFNKFKNSSQPQEK